MPHKPSFNVRRCAKQTSGNSRKSGVFAPDLVQPRHSRRRIADIFYYADRRLNTLQAALIVLGAT